MLSGYEPTRKALIKRMVYMFFGDSVHNKRVIQGKVPWHLLLLSAVLALSAFLDLSRLTSGGYANLYYAATVKDTLTSWHNCFFASYDAGFVSVDKPPLGFWIQATSAYLFGFHGGAYCFPRRSLGSSVWPCSTTWCAAASGQWQACLRRSLWLSPRSASPQTATTTLRAC